jgi:hypothetical protein
MHTHDMIMFVDTIHSLQHSCWLKVTFTLVIMWLPHAIEVQLTKKSNMVDYIFMYDAFITLYKGPIYN